MKRALLTAGSGLLYFVISVLLMMPLRMSPVANYNLIFLPCLVFLFFILFYKTCSEHDPERETQSYLYGFFAAIVAWQVFGEVASITVPSGYVLRVSDLNLKSIGAAFFVICGWVILKVLWQKKTVKPSLLVFLMVFLGIWTFELYMENYSSLVPLTWMPIVATTLGALFLFISIVLVFLAARVKEPAKQTIIGCVLYLTLSITLMGFSQWQKPQTFYLNSESELIRKEIIQLEAKQHAIEDLKLQIADQGKE